MDPESSVRPLLHSGQMQGHTSKELDGHIGGRSDTGSVHDQRDLFGFMRMLVRVEMSDSMIDR